MSEQHNEIQFLPVFLILFAQCLYTQLIVKCYFVLIYSIVFWLCTQTAFVSSLRTTLSLQLLNGELFAICVSWMGAIRPIRSFECRVFDRRCIQISFFCNRCFWGLNRIIGMLSFCPNNWFRKLNSIKFGYSIDSMTNSETTADTTDWCELNAFMGYHKTVFTLHIFTRCV